MGEIKEMKNIKNLVKVFLLVISVGWASEAYLTPGPPGGGRQPAPYPGNPGGGPGGGGLVPGQPGRPRPPMPPPPPSSPGNPYPGQPGYPNNPYPPYPNDPYPSPGYPNDPYPGQPSYGYEVKRIYIGRDIFNETLPLRQLAGIGREFNGWEVVSVRARTRPTNSGRTVAQLVSDNRVMATQINPGYQIDLRPQFRLVLGQTAGTLQLGISGSTFIDTIEIELRRDGGGYNPPPPPPGYGENIEINIYRSVFGSDRIDLTQYIDMYRYRGRVIEQVLVTATARYNVGFMDLLINGFNMGRAQFSGGYSQIATFRLNQHMVIGQGADSVVLYTQGDMTIEHVTIVVR